MRTSTVLTLAGALLFAASSAPGEEQAKAPASVQAPAKAAAPKPKSRKPDTTAQALRKAEAELRELHEKVAEQEATIARQQGDLARQDELVRALEERIARLEKVAAASLDRLQAVEADKSSPEAAALEARMRKLEENVRKLPEATDVVSVGDFPGSFTIPGTDAALKIGGQVRVTAVFSLDAIGTDDRFVTSSIPVTGSDEAGKGARTVLTANPSRFNFDFRTPTGVGAMRAFIETGFGGPGATLNLRHAFGQWNHLILGQTWSTFADPEAEPFGIDNEGLNAIALFRQPQIRYTTSIGESYTLAAAMENPAPDVTNASGVNQVPDFVVRARWQPSKGQGMLPIFGQLGHVQAAVLLRQIRAAPVQDPNQTVSKGGFGFGVSGRIRTGWWSDKDDVTFAVYAGNGIGRYITDLRTAGGQDGYFDLATGELTVLGVAAAYVGYEHAWSPTLRSTATVGWVWVNVLENQPGEALKYTRRFSLNLAWTPIPRLDLVGEVLTGERTNKDLGSGSATQIQLGSRFRF